MVVRKEPGKAFQISSVSHCLHNPANSFQTFAFLHLHINCLPPFWRLTPLPPLHYSFVFSWRWYLGWELRPVYRLLSFLGSLTYTNIIIFCCCLFVVLCLLTQSCLTLCKPKDCSPAGSSVHGILQARILEWSVMPFSRGSSQSRDQTQVSCIAGRFFTTWATIFPY